MFAYLAACLLASRLSMTTKAIKTKISHTRLNRQRKRVTVTTDTFVNICIKLSVVLACP